MRGLSRKKQKSFGVFFVICVLCGVFSQEVSVLATTRTLNVETHTKDEIRQYIKQHTGDGDAEMVYSTQPSTDIPYAAGVLSDATLQNALDALNEIRYIAGIYDGVVLDSNYTARCQAGTLVNAVNGILEHEPAKPADMEQSLYELGYEGTSSSNIAMGYSDFISVVRHGWMADEDAYNIDRLGHRRWCLNPEMGKTGFGYTSGYSAMYSFDTSYSVTEDKTVVWPAQNMPTDFFEGSYPWSVSSDVAFADDVKVVLTQLDGDADASNDKVWEFSSVSADGYFNYSEGGYGQRHCLIFRPDDIPMYFDNDKYQVQVLENGVVTLEYIVNFFDLVPIPDTVTMTLNSKYGKLSESYIGSSFYMGMTSLTISDSSISANRIVVSSSDDTVAKAIVRDNGDGTIRLSVRGISAGVAQITLQLTKNIKAVYKVTVGDGGGHVHKNIEVSKEEATCTETGLSYLECEGCGVPSTEVIPTIDHDYDDGIITIVPTCYSEGERTRTCSMCKGTTTEEVAKVDHEYETSYTIDKAPSCKEEGSKSYHCVWYSQCETSQGTVVLEKTDDHDYDDGVVTTAPTCTTEGEKTFTCSICEGARTEDVAVVDHEYETAYTVDKAPSCKEEGSQSYHCKWYAECGELTGATVIEKTDDHSYDEGVVTKAPTCTTVGDRTLTCEICEGTKVIDEPTVPHEYETTYTVDKTPSCKEEGSKSYHCIWHAECGLGSQVTAIEKTDDHDYDEGVVTTEPTCSTEGVRTFTCAICDGTRTEAVDIVSHNYEEDFTVDVEATCVEEGSESRHCVWYELCSESIEETVIAKNDNHSFNEGEVTIPSSCTKEGVRTFTCVRCLDTKTGPEPLKPHSYDEGVVTKTPTCTVKGERTFTCEDCAGIKVEPVKMVAHEYDAEFTVDKEATCTTNGSKSKHCKACDSKTDMTVIQAAGHVAGEWIVDKEPTYEESGSRHKECSVCHAVVESESIEKLVAKKGATVAVGGANYSISSSSAGKNTVTYAGPQVKSVATVSVPSTIRIGSETYKVTTISANAFANCKQLKTVKIGKNVTKVGKNAFSGCTKLSKVTLPSKLTVIESGAFANCRSLKSITIPASVKKIGSKVFYKCKKLKKITIKTTKLKSSTVGNKAFSGVHQKAKVKVPKKKFKAYKKFLKKKGLPKKATIKK